MHIKKIEIRNIKSIKAFDMAFRDDEALAGWHVLIGDNGSGKSTVLQAIALAFLGAGNASGLNEDWGKWLPRGEFYGKQKHLAALEIVESRYDKLNAIGYFHPYFELYSNMRDMTAPIVKSMMHGRNIGGMKGNVTNNKKRQDLSRNWLGDETGWFSAAYGPYRRFTGSSTEYDRIFANNPKLAAHLSVFREDSALTEVIEWLRNLRFQEVEAQQAGQKEGFFLDKLRDFINHGEFLPYGAQLKNITSAGVFFTDANGSTITIQNLSDGYRSILSMTLEMIRQMQIAYQTDDLFSEDFASVKMPGVVLIDEVDAHLHPTWQRKIGPWFRQHFPNVQFIVTTHSPLICQAAVEGGSVWKLPRPGTDETCERVEGQDLNRLLYGDILEAYSTDLFGLTETRSQEGQDKLKRLGQLNVKEVLRGLTEAEQREQQELRAAMPTEANARPSETPSVNEAL